VLARRAHQIRTCAGRGRGCGDGEHERLLTNAVRLDVGVERLVELVGIERERDQIAVGRLQDLLQVPLRPDDVELVRLEIGRIGAAPLDVELEPDGLPLGGERVLDLRSCERRGERGTAVDRRSVDQLRLRCSCHVYS
jgi:hypothetical protein